ncbi:MAG: hypothetical protein IJP17_02705, partial [Clostridia bacterium]|nr:hypothetical protein [Clostridia bacterium]
MTLNIRRLTALMLCLVLAVSLCACGKQDKQKEEFADIAEIFIIRGVEVCEDIYLGGGLDANVPDSVTLDFTHGTYYPVASEDYTSIAQLKGAAEAVFDAPLAESWLYADAFGGDAPLYKETDGVLYVNIARETAGAFGVEWLYDTLTVTAFSEDAASVTIQTIDVDESVQTREISFIHTAGGWRISSPLYGEGVV